MKKYLAVYLILFSTATLLGQSINFSDKKALEFLLCNKTWVRYYIHDASSVSDSVMDSIKFYSNGTFYKSAEPKIDSLPDYIPDPILTGKWDFGETGKTSPKDTATEYIILVGQVTGSNGTSTWYFALVDGRRMKGNGCGKMNGNLDRPFVVGSYPKSGLDCDTHRIWQQTRKPPKGRIH